MQRAEDLARRVETRLPGVARGCYVTGSVADGLPLAASDLDLVAVLRNGVSEREREAVRAIAHEVADEVGVDLDLDLVEVAALAGGVDPQLKRGSILVHGEDLVAAAPLLPIEEWARQRMHAGYYLMVSVFGRPPAVRQPLDYPVADDPFFGYALRDVRLPDGRQVPSTRNLVRVSSWMATALLAWTRRRYVVRKSECHIVYREEIGGEWSDFLERVYECCRSRWQYLIPEGESDRVELRAIGAEMLRFERHYLAMYRDFVLGELRAGGDRAEKARWVLGQIPFGDEEILLALAVKGKADV